MRPKKKIFIFHANQREASLLRYMLDIRMHHKVSTAGSREELYARSAGMDLLVHFRPSRTEIIRGNGASVFYPSSLPRHDLLNVLRMSLQRKRGPMSAEEYARAYVTKKAYGDRYREQRRVAA